MPRYSGRRSSAISLQHRIKRGCAGRGSATSARRARVSSRTGQPRLRHLVRSCAVEWERCFSTDAVVDDPIDRSCCSGRTRYREARPYRREAHDLGGFENGARSAACATGHSARAGGGRHRTSSASQDTGEALDAVIADRVPDGKVSDDLVARAAAAKAITVVQRRTMSGLASPAASSSRAWPSFDREAEQYPCAPGAVPSPGRFSGRRRDPRPAVSPARRCPGPAGTAGSRFLVRLDGGFESHGRSSISWRR